MRYIFFCFLTLLIGCTTAQQPQISLRAVPKKAPPHPHAVTHFLRGRLAESAGQRDRAIEELQAAVRYDSTSATLYSALARNLNAIRRFKNAVEPARRAVQIDPKNVQIRWLYYEALSRGLRDTTRAIGQLNAIVRLAPRDLNAYQHLFQIYEARGQRRKVITLLDSIVAMPGLMGAREKLFAAETYHRQRAFDKAAHIYRDILKDDPNNDDLQFKLGITHLSRGDTLSAEQNFRGIIARQDYSVTRETVPVWVQLVHIYSHEPYLNRLFEEPDVRLVDQLGNVLLRMVKGRRDHDEKMLFVDMAERVLNHQLQTDPKNQTLLGIKARLLLDANRTADARKTYRHANLQGEKTEYHLGIARSYRAEENWASAQQILEKLHRDTRPESEYYDQVAFDLARVYLRQNEIAQARTIYQQAVAARPKNTGFRYELARTYLFDRNWEKAIPLLEPLVADTEDNPEFFEHVLFDLGRSLERAGQFDRAVAVFQRLLALDQDHADASNYLGYMLAERGERLTEAKKLIERALKIDPENGAYLDSLGWVYYQLKQYENAARWLDRALTVEEETLRQTDPNSPIIDGLRENLAVIHEHAGDAAQKMGDLERASYHYERAIEFDPDNQTLREKFKNLSRDASSSE
ncbi:MAG: tetratricopeptide repeat protein [Gemmatimonadetes bacterium]|nr:tetratricopeptide repeat protein [Gemmatimonadota bacterium]